MGRILVFIAAIAIIAVVAFVLFTIVDCFRTSHREKVEQRRREEEERMRFIAECGGHSCDPFSAADKCKHSQKKKKKDRRSKKNGDENGFVGETDLSMDEWFSMKYPAIATKPCKRSNMFDEVCGSIAAIGSREASIRKFSNMLPQSYRDNLDAISIRITQISDKTDDDHILQTIESYRESIEKSTLNYIGLAGAPVRNESIIEAMAEIEDAIASVPSLLDSILASCYDQDSMNALIEAGSLKAIIEHNKMMFTGMGNTGEVQLGAVSDDLAGYDIAPEKKTKRHKHK